MAVKKPLFTQKMKQKCLAFALYKKYKNNKNWMSEQRRDVIFTDEATFVSVNRRIMTVSSSKTMDWYIDKYIMKSLNQAPHVMMWACFSGKSGMGGL
jgi:hypothetical protein